MTLAKRISVARTLTIVQLVITILIAVVALGTAALILLGPIMNGVHPEAEAGGKVMIIVMLIVGILAIVLSTALPFVVLTALKKRTEAWATAAFVCLIIQIVVGGGLLSVFPIITLVLLLDKEASAYIGMK